MTITMIIVVHKNCSPLPDRQVFLVQRGEGGRLGRTEAPTEYFSHDNVVEYYSHDDIVEYYSHDNVVKHYSRDDVDGDEGKVSKDDEEGGLRLRLNIFLMIILFNIILKII